MDAFGSTYTKEKKQTQTDVSTAGQFTKLNTCSLNASDGRILDRNTPEEPDEITLRTWLGDC